MHVLSIRMHVSDVDDCPHVVKKSDAQGDISVAHPHTMAVRLRKDEKHTVIEWQGKPVHQAQLTGLKRCSNLCRDVMPPCAELEYS